jgi:LacI family transcriptional regulator
VSPITCSIIDPGHDVIAPVTLKEVAAECGVSTATVSAVVNGADWVSAETRSRVQRAIDSMGYRPNQLARGLKLRQGHAIGVVVSDLTNPFFTEVARSFSNALREDGRAIFLCDSDHKFDVGERNFRMLLDRQVDGVVLIGDTVPEEVLKRYVRRRNHIPVIAIEREYHLEGVSCLLVDSEQGGYVATRHLIEQGCRRIAHIGGPHEGAGSTTFGRLARLEGYRRALREAGLPEESELIAEANFRYAGGQEAMRQLLRLRERPDGVFAANDMMALGALHAAQEAGLRVPDDLLLVGNDDIPFADLSQPGLTTMAMPKRELGRAAAELISDQMPRRGAHDDVRRMLSAELVVRGSSTRGAGAHANGDGAGHADVAALPAPRRMHPGRAR